MPCSQMMRMNCRPPRPIAASSVATQPAGCYVVNPISGTNLVQGIAQLAASGKAIVNIDSPVDPAAAQAANAKIATYIGTDNAAAGKTAAQELSRLLPSGGKVAVVCGYGDVGKGCADQTRECIRSAAGRESDE